MFSQSLASRGQILNLSQHKDLVCLVTKQGLINQKFKQNDMVTLIYSFSTLEMEAGELL